MIKELCDKCRRDEGLHYDVHPIEMYNFVGFKEHKRALCGACLVKLRFAIMEFFGMEPGDDIGRATSWEMHDDQIKADAAWR